MKNEKEKTIRYTIEREFLAKITVTELVSRIIQSHMKNNAKNENILHERNIGKIPCL